MTAGPPQPPDDSPTGDPLVGRNLGRYRILGLVGSGGMGTVYEAEDTELQRRVALKVLPTDVAADPTRLERFRREARAAAALGHPNIVTLHSVEEADGVHFLTMELVRGEPLDRLIPERGLDLGEIVDRGAQLADGLRAAHEQGIVHRDLKPANVIVDTEGRVRVLDFGLASAPRDRATASEERTALDLTAEGTVLGTAPYMSPEQVAGEPLDARSDIFSLGSILYEMATGQRPFAGESQSRVMTAILRDPPIALRELRSDLPAPLERIIDRCLAKQPAQRYQSARELRDALAELQSGSSTTVVATVASTRARLGRWAAIGLVGLALLAGVWWASRLGMDRASSKPEPAAGEDRDHQKLIAVLPLRNLGLAEDEFFAAGITEEIISRLATVPGLGVVSSSSANSGDATEGINEIGAQLGVDFVLSGSVQWAREPDGTSRVRIRPRLVRVSDNLHLWAEAYDRRMESIFDLQAEIALKVARELGAALMDEDRDELAIKPTENQTAYQLYLRGRFGADSVNCSIIRERIRPLERAVVLDPGFLQAWTTLAQARAAAFGHCDGRAEADRAGASEALDQAQHLAPDSWQFLVAEAQYLTQVERDYDQALGLLQRAAEQITKSQIFFAQGRIYRRQGRWELALEAFERTAELDPRSVQVVGRLGAVHMWMRNYEEAIEQYHLLTELAPEANQPYLRMAWSHWLATGGTDEARAVLEVLPLSSPSRYLEWGWFWQRVYEGRLQEAIDGLGETRGRELLRIPGYVAPRPLLEAQAYSLMGESRLARELYESARQQLEAQLDEMPGDSDSRSALAVAYAGLGLRTEALRTIAETLAAEPIDLEPYWGQPEVQRAALVHTLLGEPETALEYLETLLAMPSPVTIAWLRLDPRWEPLWDQPGFAELEARYGDTG